MTTKTDFRGKPIVRICAHCQQINVERMKRFAMGISQKIKDEMKVVDEKVNENREKYSFTHTMCVPHGIQQYQSIPGMTKERINSLIDKYKSNNTPAPCLIEDTPEAEKLRQSYMMGLFTDEEVQSQQQSNHQLVERFKTLAGIKSCFD